MRTFNRLPYLRAAICEIQRFADITPAGIMHSTTEDVQFHGYDLPKVRTIMNALT